MKNFTFVVTVCFALGALWIALICGNPFASAAQRPATQPTVPDAVHTEVHYQLQVLDAKHFGPTMAGGLATSVSAPVSFTDAQIMSRSGALADGASVLVIRWATVAVAGATESIPAAAPYPVTFTIADGNYPVAEIGSLSAAMPTLPAPLGGAAGSKASVTIPAGSPDVVFYCPPDQYKFPATAASDTAVPLQNAKITLTVSGGGGTLATGNLDVVRPQIILVHGFLSSPATWSGLSAALLAEGLPAGQAVEANYSAENDSGYAGNCNVVPDEIAATVFGDEFPNNPKTAQIAATRLDVVGHSMGGVLAAWYAAGLANTNLNRGDGFPAGSGTNEPFQRALNFGVGDIRRFISVGSPFQGSPVASYIVQNFSYNQIKFLVPLTGTQDDAAFWDLSTISSATNDIDSATASVNWLPIAGIAGNGGGGLGAPWAAVENAFNIVGLGPGVTSANSDLIVLQTSAEDGAAAGLNADVVQNVVHTAETTDATVYSDIESALDLGAKLGGSKLFNKKFTP